MTRGMLTRTVAKLGGRVKKFETHSGADRFKDVLEVIRADLNCRMLIDQANGENKAEAAVLPHQRTLNSLHYTTPDPHLLAENQFRKRLDSLLAKLRP